MSAIGGLASDEKLQIKAVLFEMTTDTLVKNTYGGSKVFCLPKKVEPQEIVTSPPVVHKPQYRQMNCTFACIYNTSGPEFSLW